LISRRTLSWAWQKIEANKKGKSKSLFMEGEFSSKIGTISKEIMYHMNFGCPLLQRLLKNI